ncbi:MAG: hypothetical protein ACSLFD_03960 [Solirubrobacterales bacterium]
MLLAALIFGLAAAQSGTVGADAANAAKHRVGGKVKKAWPRTAGVPPKTRLAKWLARQVGPVRACGKKRNTGPKKARQKANDRRRRCLRWHRRIGLSAAADTSAPAGDPGAPLSSPPRASVSASDKTDPTLLARSYQIPKDDPDYERLVNWSWTYDSAVTAAAFVSLGEERQATQMLDQLAALQFNTGAIDIAFNVTNGEGASLFRSGNVAWLGLAAASYDLRFDSDRYLDTARRSAEFLLELQSENGLVRGGPKIEWSSTLHNLIAYTFLVRLAKADPKGADRYLKAAERISAAIHSDLMVDDKSGLHFRQGLDDDVEPLDVQAVGSMFLAGQDQRDQASEVLDRIPENFGVKQRKIQLSSNVRKYNMTWSSKEFFSGFKPYSSNKVPSVIWFEGTAQVRAATAANGGDVKGLDSESKKWREVTAKGGSAAPLQANETVTDINPDIDAEYHVWPAAAGAAWWILAANDPEFLIP